MKIRAGNSKEKFKLMHAKNKHRRWPWYCCKFAFVQTFYLWRNLTFSRDSSTSPNDSFFCHKVKLNSILIKSDCGRSMVRVSTCSESNTFHQKEIPDNDNIGKTTTLTLHLEKIMPILAIMDRDYFEGNFELCSHLSVFHTAHRFDHKLHGGAKICHGIMRC